MVERILLGYSLACAGEDTIVYPGSSDTARRQSADDPLAQLERLVLSHLQPARIVVILDELDALLSGEFWSACTCCLVRVVGAASKSTQIAFSFLRTHQVPVERLP